MIVKGVMTVIFALLGVLFALGKGDFLIAGYNSATADEKAKLDRKRILKNLSAAMFCCAACAAVTFLGSLTGVSWLSTIGFCLFLPCLIFFLIRINKRDRK